MNESVPGVRMANTILGIRELAAVLIVLAPVLVASLLTAEARAQGGRVSAAYAPRVGDLHADIVLRTIEHDRTIALSQFRGKKILLVHFASW